ncbi:MAG: DUF349 domain-containing protein [Oligoflexia bacterium]|nr:DUF349 domain-containing protein [Oligoflexia bacterium]
MKIRDLFTPRWKHSNPKERLSALKEIVSKDILKEIILNDSAQDVIREALKKIDDYNFFSSWIDKIGNHPFAVEIHNYVETLILKILCEKALTMPKEEIESLLSRIKNGDKLLSLYKNFERSKETQESLQDKDSKYVEICNSILSHISDEKIIYRFLKDVDFSTGLEVLVNRINDGETLKRLFTSAKNKKIRKFAEQRLEEKKEQYENLSVAEIRKRLSSIISQVKGYITEKKWEEGYNEFSGMINKWKRLDTKGKHPLKSEFDLLANSLEENIGKYRELVSQMQDLLAKKERAEEVSIETLKELDISLLRDEELILWEGKFASPLGYHRSTYSTPHTSHSSHVLTSTAATDTTNSTTVNKERDKEAGVLQHLSRVFEEIKRFDNDWISKRVSLNVAAKRMKEFEGLFENIQQIGDERVEDLKKEFENIKFRLKDSIETAVNNFEESKRKEKELQQRADEIVVEIEKSIENKARNIKPLQDEFDKIDKDINLNRDLIKRYRAAADKFYEIIRKQKEDRHWEEWASYKHRKDLCEEIKKLSSDINQEFIGNKVMELQAKWRDAGRVTREQFEELNNEFKSCADIIFKECSQKKDEVVNKLQDVLQVLDENKEINFKDISEKVEFLHQEWRSIGQIPLALEKESFERFNQLKSKFFKRKEQFFQERDKEREENLIRKQALLAELERVVAEPYDKQTKIDKLKVLRARWKEIGPIPKSVTTGATGAAGASTTIEDPWIKFKSICDGFFNSLNEEKQVLVTQKEQLISELQEILNTLDEVKLEDFEEKQAAIHKLEDSWDDLQIPHRELDNKFNNMINSFERQKNEKFERLKREQQKKVSEKLQILSKMEREYITLDWQKSLHDLQQLKSSFEQISTDNQRMDSELQERMQRVFRVLENESNLWKMSEGSGSGSGGSGSGMPEQEVLSSYQTLIDHLAVIVKIVNPKVQIDQTKIDLGPAEQISLGIKLKSAIVDKDRPEKTYENALKEVSKIQDKWCKQKGILNVGEREKIWKHYKYVLGLFLN